MGLFFEELNSETRAYMLREFIAEQNSTNPYRSQTLTTIGLQVFPKFMIEAINSGNDETLTSALLQPSYWSSTERYFSKGAWRERKVNVSQAVERLSRTEFNTFYVRGLARLFLDAGVSTCEIYRAGEPKWAPAECSDHEGKIVSVETIYNGHRARYWPAPGDPSAFSIPFVPGCHHTIRRVRQQTESQSARS